MLSGRITQRGDNLTISVELVDIRNDKLLWGEQYDRKASELLTTQREIAREIADNLRLKVSPQERGLAKHYTESRSAHRASFSTLARQWYGHRLLVCMGRFDEAIAELKRAQELDPLSLIINADLGDTYTHIRQ